MATNRFLTLISGVYTLVTGISTSSGAGDANKLVSTGADGYLSATLLPAGFGGDIKILPAFEALAAGDLVNVFLDAGAAKVRKADASSAGKQAHGFVQAAVASGASATVYFEGANTQNTSLTIGAVLYLSATTAGRATNVAPSTAGQVVQEIGVSVSATEYNFEPQRPVTLA
jgi:hypothetical protein